MDYILKVTPSLTKRYRQMNKSKVIVIAVILLMASIVVYLFATAGDNSSSENQVANTPSVEVQESFTYSDMMAIEAEKGNRSPAPETESAPAAPADIPITEPEVPVETVSESDAVHHAPARAKRTPVMPSNRSVNGIAKSTPPANSHPRPVSGKRGVFIDSSIDPAPVNASNIPAVTHGDQVIVDGGTIKLRLTSNSTISGTVVPSNTIVFGDVEVSDRRVTINISSIRAGGRLLDVSLVAYDQIDGSKGLKLDRKQVADDVEEGIGSATDAALDQTTVSTIPVIGSLSQTATSMFKKRHSRGVVISANYKLILR